VRASEKCHMSEQTVLASVTGLSEATNGVPDAVPLPMRNAARGMLPGTWLGQGLRAEYVDCHGSSQETSGVYLDHCPVGLIMNVRDARTLIGWDRSGLLELIE
jgi:hypothetical protein